MGEKEDKEKAEKLAAAKKRVAQLQKKKKAAGSADKGPSVSSKKSKDRKEDAPDATEEGDLAVDAAAAEAEGVEDLQPKHEEEDVDADSAALNEVVKSANERVGHFEGDEADERAIASPPLPAASPSDEVSSAKPQHRARQPSVFMQSKIRSASFRQSATPTSPGADGDEFPDIYRKQMARIEELEKENKRLAKEAQESQVRWQKNEDELEELREAAVETKTEEDNDEVLKLRSEIDTLRRNSRASISVPKGKVDEDVDSLRKEVERKEAGISDMQLEISRLRSQVSSLTTEGKNENEQIAALQENLSRAEASNAKFSSELADVKKALSKASEKAVMDGTERTSKDTKIKALEREVETLTTEKEEVERKVESLEKKIEAMNKLHRETEQRSAPKLASADATIKELQMVKAKLEATEKESLRLREARKHRMSGDGAEEGLDELEHEERKKLEQQIRDLEGENYDLRRGVWRDRRQQMQPNLSLDDNAGNGDDFDEVDLNGSGFTTRKGSTMNPPPMQTKHSGFAQVFNSGLAAFRASTTSPDTQGQKQQTVGRPRNDSLLEEFDDDAFDESAFAVAQREEEMKKMVAHVREVKKGLKQWSGWRLDLVDVRRSGSAGVGFGEIFDV